MPLIIAALWGGLIQVLGTLVGRILVSLGVGYLTYTGIDTSIGWAKAQFLSSLSGLPASALQIMGLLKVGICVSMLLSAVTMRMVLKGMQGGSIKRMTLK